MPNVLEHSLTRALALALIFIAPAEAQDSAAGVDTLDEVVVVGIRGSLGRALDQKRASTQIVDVVASEDLGKMPDQNIAESLQRIPGIQIDRSAGEGSVVRIRGLSQNLNTINGERLISGLGQANQNSSFEDLPAEMFSEVLVYKSQNAKLIEGGLGGVVDLRTRRPFDFTVGELQVAGALRAIYGVESESTKPVASVFAAKNWGDFGALISLSYAEREHLSDRAQFERGFRTSNADTTGDGAGDLDYTRARMISAQSQTQDRERFGVNLAAQWAAGDSLEITAEYFGTFLDVNRQNVSAQYWADRGLGLDVSQPFQVSPGGYVESGTIEQNFYQANVNVAAQQSEAHNFSLTADWDSGGALSGVVQLMLGNSEFENPTAFADVMGSQGNNVTFPDASSGRVNPNGIDTFTYQLDMPLGAEIPVITSDGALLDPTRYWNKSQWASTQETDADLAALKLDFEWALNRGDATVVSFGARYADRDVDVGDFRYLNEFNGFQYFFKDAQIQDATLGYTILPVVTNADDPSRLVRYDNFFSTSSGRFPSSLLIENPAGMQNAVAWLSGLYPNAPLTKALRPINSYGVQEKTLAAYAMADLEGKLGTTPYALNVGVRLVRTEQDVMSNEVPGILADGSANNNAVPNATGFNGTAIEWTGVTNSRSYTDILPSLTARFSLTDELDLKASVNSVIARPSLGNLGQGFNVFYSGIFEPGGPQGQFQRYAAGSAGNPNLDPDEATAYDLSLEWYFGDNSALIGALFYKDIDTFIVRQTNQEAVPDSDGVVRDGGLVSRSVNGNGGFVKGFELAYQQVFDNGIGVVLNYTYSDSENKEFLDPTSGAPLPIPGVSENSYNAIAFYENEKFRARVAYNWREERLTSIFSGFPRNTRDFGQLDASLGYDISDRFGIALEGINLTGNDTSDYLDVGEGEHFYSWSTDEARYIFTVNYKYQ